MLSRPVSVAALVFLLFQDLLTGWDDWYDERIVLYCHEGVFRPPKWFWNLEGHQYSEGTQERLQSIQILLWFMCKLECRMAMKFLARLPEVISGPLEMSDWLPSFEELPRKAGFKTGSTLVLVAKLT